jgi:hypothetical protein
MYLAAVDPFQFGQRHLALRRRLLAAHPPPLADDPDGVTHPLERGGLLLVARWIAPFQDLARVAQRLVVFGRHLFGSSSASSRQLRW